MQNKLFFAMLRVAEVIGNCMKVRLYLVTIATIFLVEGSWLQRAIAAFEIRPTDSIQRVSCVPSGYTPSSQDQQQQQQQQQRS